MMRTRSLRWLLPVVALLATGLAAAPARAQIESREGIALRDQIDELRHELQILQDRVSNGRGGSLLGSAAPYTAPPSGPAGNDVTARLLVRVDQLDDQVRQLRGRIDELQNQLQQQTADLGKRIDDLTFLVENPKAAAAAAAASRQAAAAGATSAPPSPTGTTTPPTGVLGTMPAAPTYAAPPYAGSPYAGPATAAPPGAGPPGTTRPPPRTPELAMQDGNAALARRDYATAEADAREILNGNRTSPRAYDAMFLLAQAQSGQHQYSQAALSYDDAYNRSRKGPHAPDALLGLANALVGLNDKPSACQALTKLHAEFPTLRPDLRDQVAFTYGRAGCR
jgi:TolA-binding protein